MTYGAGWLGGWRRPIVGHSSANLVKRCFMNDDKTQDAFEQAAAYQKIWTDSFSKLAQAAFTFSPDAAPPEVMRDIRSSIFQAMATSWEEFMRSPQFLESMKQLMSNAMAFRKMTNDFLTKAHHETQGTARTDIDTLMLAVRHLEERVVDCVADLKAEVQDLRGKLDEVQSRRDRAGTTGDRSAPSGPTRPAGRKGSNKRSARTSKKG